MMTWAMSGTISTTTTGSPVDLVVAEAVRGIVDVLPLGSGTCSIQFQVSADGSTNWTNIGSPIAVTTTPVHAAPDFGVGRGSGWHWRAVATIAGGSPSFLVAVQLLGYVLRSLTGGETILPTAVAIEQLAATTGDGGEGDAIDMRLANLVFVGVTATDGVTPSIEGSIDGLSWSSAGSLSGGNLAAGTPGNSFCRYIRVAWTGDGSVTGSVVGRLLIDTAGAN